MNRNEWLTTAFKRMGHLVINTVIDIISFLAGVGSDSNRQGHRWAHKMSFLAVLIRHSYLINLLLHVFVTGTELRVLSWLAEIC